LVFSLFRICAGAAPVFESNALIMSAFAAPPAPDEAFRLQLGGRKPFALSRRILDRRGGARPSPRKSRRAPPAARSNRFRAAFSGRPRAGSAMDAAPLQPGPVRLREGGEA
jgi:hypothetical protein